jgi:hypothetical protein
MKKISVKILPGCILCVLLFWATGCDNAKSDSAFSPQAGAGGSMARFAITGNTLYIVSKQSLEVFDITDGSSPVKSATRNIGVGIETIFPYQKNLFIGASNGMYIFDNSDPSNPRQLSQYSHIQSCDPVVVQGNYAYVTLRSGSACRLGAGQSSLDVIDVSNPGLPMLLNSQPMDSPYGLGVTGNKLFVCEGDNGLKVMDISDPKTPVFKTQFKDLPSYDVIALENRLIVTGKNGLFQYSLTADDKIELLSKIAVQ